MRIAIKIGLCAVLACTAVGEAHAWSVKKSNKTHVRVLVVDEDRNPIPGQKMSFRLCGGGGRKFTLASDQDGMVSFRDDIGSYAICTFDLDRKVHYPVWFEFRPDANGSIVTGVVKRIVAPPKMVNYRIQGDVSNGVDKVGLDLIYGDFVHPFGKGRHADLYLTMQTMRDESIQTGDEWKKIYSQYGFARFDSPSEFTVIHKDVGCGLPTPSLAPTTMFNNSNVVFDVDFRPDRFRMENIGDKKYVLVKVVRPNGVYYGVLTDGICCWSRRNSCNSFEISYYLNVSDGDRNIAWTESGDATVAWSKQVETWYAEEDAAKAKKAEGQNKEAVK